MLSRLPMYRIFFDNSLMAQACLRDECSIVVVRESSTLHLCMRSFSITTTLVNVEYSVCSRVAPGIRDRFSPRLSVNRVMVRCSQRSLPHRGRISIVAFDLLVSIIFISAAFHGAWRTLGSDDFHGSAGRFGAAHKQVPSGPRRPPVSCRFQRFFVRPVQFDARRGRWALLYFDLVDGFKNV